jgi:tyrosyl-tRNA synthetase
MDVLEELGWRGQLYQQTNAEAFKKHLASSQRVYTGFDPTGNSLTIGNLVAIMLLARFQRAGHSPVVIMGGGTGMIGDPSGKSAERQFMTLEQIEANIAGQRPIFERILDFSGSNKAVIINNADWLTKLSFMDALRDIGKHFSVNMMIQKDSVRDRLQNREQGISYTEFSYMLLQAYDFLHLYEQHGVTVQGAGADQWGNILGGVDLIRRKHQVEVFGVTAPLLLKADGTKFGKTADGAVWLTAERTSPYAFYQFWLNAADADVEKFLKMFTFFSQAEVAGLMQDHASRPNERIPQRTLAAHMTELLHGKTALDQALLATQALFTGDVVSLPKATLEEVFATTPSVTLKKDSLSGEGVLVVDLLVEAQVVKSKREAREMLSSGAITLNAQKPTLETRFTENALLHGELAVIRRGKKNWHVARFV